MKRTTITLSDALEQELERFVDEQAVPVLLTADVREYPGERGYLPSATRLRIRPAEQGGGQDDISVSHDEYLSST